MLPAAVALLLLLRLLWQSEAAYWSDACAWLCLWLALPVATVSAPAPAPGTAAVGDESAWAAARAAPPAGSGSVWPARWPCSAPANVASHASPADADAGADAGADAADAAACSCCAFAAVTWSAICAGASMCWPQLDVHSVPIAAVGSAGRWIDRAACHSRIHPDPYRPHPRPLPPLRCHHRLLSRHHHRHHHPHHPPLAYAVCD